MNDPEEKCRILQKALQQIADEGCIYKDCAWFIVSVDECRNAPPGRDGWCPACVAADALERAAR